MNNATGILIALAIGVVLVATLLFLVVPEPSQRAVVATERLDVAVLAFRNSSTWTNVEETVRGRIETKLVNTPGVSVFSRAQLDALLMEQALGSSGMIDPTTAVEIGRLTGVTKLITGAIYAVDTQSEETTMCTAWKNGNCTETVPAIRYSVRISAQIEVIDARTGRIEQSRDITGSDSATAPTSSTFGGFDSLLAAAASQIADRAASNLVSTYTRELRYGLYHEYETKQNGYVGHGTSSRYEVGETAHLIVHFTRIRNHDLFDVVWLAPDGSVLERVADVVNERDWRLYELDLTRRSPGRYRVQGTLNGSVVFDEPFSIVP